MLTGKKFIIGRGFVPFGGSATGYKTGNLKARIYDSVEEIMKKSDGRPVEIFEIEIKEPRWYQTKTEYEEIESPKQSQPENCIDEDVE